MTNNDDRGGLFRKLKAAKVAEIHVESCPCCGGAAKIRWEAGFGAYPGLHYVICLACGLRGPPFLAEYFDHERCQYIGQLSDQLAAEHWNRRPA